MNLNVCGLCSKLECEDFLELIQSYDLIFLQETKLDNLDVQYVEESLDKLGFTVFFRNRFEVSNRKSGGILVAVKHKYAKNCIRCNPKSEYVLWLKMSKSVFGLKSDILFGGVYIAPEGSPYSTDLCYDDIESELSNLDTAEGENSYVCLIGDFNSRTGKQSEFVSFDKALVEGLGFESDLIEAINAENNLELLGINGERVTRDTRSNNYGNNLIGFCKSNSLYVFNGRLGKDTYEGRFTTTKNSIVDYYIGSPQMLTLVHEFEVLPFDRLYSDIHCPVHCVLKAVAKTDVGIVLTDEIDGTDEVAHECNVSTKVYWEDEKVENFVDAIEHDKISELADRCDENNVDTICKELAETLLNAAEKVFKTKCRVCSNKKKPKRKSKHEWFNAKCNLDRNVYRRAKRRLRQAALDPQLQEQYKTANKQYKKTIRKARSDFFKAQAKKFRNLKSTDPNQYWKLLNAGKQKKTCRVGLEQLYEHFKTLNASTHGPPQNDGFAFIDDVNDVLNEPISEEEILKNVKLLKMKKASGLDNISNEYLKHGIRKLLPLIVVLFNKVLDTGVIPTSWGVGKIIPIYKNKGNIYDPNNYRGITILSCLGKLFTGILNSRLAAVVKINENQAGFRSGYSTVDHVFVLRSLVDLFLASKMKLYCAFVDFQKAFDTVWHTGLWQKLLEHGVTGKVFKCIFNMYQNIKSCVSTDEGCSEFFSVFTGVRQGENLSPLLFAIYVNDLESYLMNKNCQYIPVGKYPELSAMLKVLVLLYADDTALLSSSATGLQKCLDTLAEYCDDWKLLVNVEKTKVMIFSRRKVDFNFTYRGRELETVSSFKYLGVVISSNGKYTDCKKHLEGQGTKAMYCILRKGRRLQLPVDVMLHLFDTTVAPILLYSCEVWGTDNCEILEKVQRKFCKHLLVLKQSTPNCMVYGETGQFPLRVHIKQRIVNYWAKLVSRPNKEALVCKVYSVLYQLHQRGSYTSPWLDGVRLILCENGFGNVWLSQSFINQEWLKQAMKLRLQDQYKQEWKSNIENMPKCITYNIIKDEWGLEQYLLSLPRNLRIPLCKFRTSNHKLPVERGRYQNIPRHERYCTLCNTNKLGDEFHFLLECTALENMRKKYIDQQILRSRNVITFKRLMSQEDRELLKVAHFVKNGFKLL